jgi:predicted small secreted protein
MRVWRKKLETGQPGGEDRVLRGMKYLLIAITLGMAVTLAACFTMQKVGCDLLQLTSCPTATATP